jgi:hypothetical protein
MSVEEFNELFILRLQFSDYIADEYNIISKLKNHLIHSGISEDNINIFLFNFYNFINVPISLEEIENVPMNDDFYELYLPPIIEINYINNQGIIHLIGDINDLINPIMEDVLVTTDENTINQLKILNYSQDNNDDCTICLDNMKENDEYYDIKCKHIFHKDCLFTYLKNYNHICPVCRIEIGNARVHINN